MRSSRCVFSSATALHRVFIAPIELQSKLQVHVQVRQLSFTSTTLAPLRSRLQSQPQCGVSNSNVQKRHVSLHVAEKSRLPRDDEIKAYSVTLVDPDGKLTDPRATSSILSRIDRKTESLVVIVPGSPGVPPICKILNKQAMRVAEKAKLKAARGTGVTQKTMELNWAIGRGDLGHRMGKLRGWLEKGWRVEVVIAGKKKGRKVLGTLTMYLEGKQQQQGKKGKKGAGDAAGAVVEGEANLQGEGDQEAMFEKSANVDVDAGQEVSERIKSVEKGEGSATTRS
ncbi:hypothetical protein DL98DRAFT_116 [Cadophora sp. DSE1049]|nr:hypothetical protein DL98DRAFT_116 [Cadophora sp. DSE1049]